MQVKNELDDCAPRIFEKGSKEGNTFAGGLQANNLTIVSCDSDGNCEFRAISVQIYGNQELHRWTRHYICDFIELESERFEPLLADGKTIETHVRRMRRFEEWGDHLRR